MHTLTHTHTIHAHFHTLFFYDLLLYTYLFLHKGQNSDKPLLSFLLKIKTHCSLLSAFKYLNRKDLYIAYPKNLVSGRENMETNGIDNMCYESSRNDLYRSNVVIQFSKDKQYGLNGTQCQIHVTPVTEALEFEVSQKNVHGMNHYEYKTVKKNNHYETNETQNKEIKDHVICRLWLYCIGLILIAIGLCLIAVGAVSNSKGNKKL